MTTPSRSALIIKTFKVLKKHYTPASPPTDRTLLEHMLYACCLEDADHQKADDAFALIQQLYFDWNEVRVTTVAELTEVMKALPDPEPASRRIKSALQSLFEADYTYDLESYKKLNIGKAVKKLEKFKGVSSFVVSYINQNALNGHAIGVDQGTLDALYVIGIASESEVKKKHVPGMERAIPKTKGVEFSSLLHQLGAAYFSSPFSPKLRAILLEISPSAKNRFPKRSRKVDEEKEKAEIAKKESKKSAEDKKVVDKSKAEKPADKKKKSATKAVAPKEKKKKSAPKTAQKKTTKKAAKTKKKSTTQQLTRRKPR